MNFSSPKVGPSASDPVTESVRSSFSVVGGRRYGGTGTSMPVKPTIGCGDG